MLYGKSHLYIASKKRGKNRDTHVIHVIFLNYQQKAAAITPPPHKHVSILFYNNVEFSCPSHLSNLELRLGSCSRCQPVVPIKSDVMDREKNDSEMV